jgi:hypothetical protein
MVIVLSEFRKRVNGLVVRDSSTAMKSLTVEKFFCYCLFI